MRALREGRAAIDEQLPAAMRSLLDLQLQSLSELQQWIEHVEVQIAAQQEQLEHAKQLDEVPGIGLLGATALAATLGDGSGWRNGREFAACLGLVPQHSGTGGKTRIGHLSKRGDPYLRTLLIHGARAVIERAARRTKWLEQLLVRRPKNVAVVALANKMARTAWALVAHGSQYKRDWQSTRPAHGCGAAQAAAA
jgi:transposase